MSKDIINEMAREAIASGTKRLREKEDLDHQERQIDVAQKRANTVTLQVQNAKLIQDTYRETCPGQQITGYAKIMFQDRLLNINTMGSTNTQGQQLIADGENCRVLVMTTFAIELGIHLTDKELRSSGVIMAKLFRQKYPNTAIPKQPLQFKGFIRDVNTYARTDADLMEQAIMQVVAKRATQ